MTFIYCTCRPRLNTALPYWDIGTGMAEYLRVLARFLNIRLDNISVEDPERHPHMVSAYLFFNRSQIRMWGFYTMQRWHSYGGRSIFYPYLRRSTVFERSIRNRSRFLVPATPDTTFS